jgi:hypothetical protein
MIRREHLETTALAPVVVRRDIEIHRTNPGPYHARLHFSYGDYQDPRYMGIGALRVLNHEVHPPAAKLRPLPHLHVQRVTHVLAGALCHRDLALEGRLDPGGVQRMTLAENSEYLEWNPLPNEVLEFVDIWIGPNRHPVLHAEQRQYHLDDRRNRWLHIARPHGRPGTGVAVDGDASVMVAHVEPRITIEHRIAPGRCGYVYVIRGDPILNAHVLHAGDAAFVSAAGRVVVEAAAPAELLLVDTAD